MLYLLSPSQSLSTKEQTLKGSEKTCNKHSGSAVKNLPATQELQEVWVRFLDREEPPEESMVTHSSILAWRIPWTEEAGGLQATGLLD